MPVAWRYFRKPLPPLASTIDVERGPRAQHEPADDLRQLVGLSSRLILSPRCPSSTNTDPSALRAPRTSSPARASGAAVVEPR